MYYLGPSLKDRFIDILGSKRSSNADSVISFGGGYSKPIGIIKEMKRTKSSEGVINRDMIYGLGTPINDEIVAELNKSRKERSKSYTIGLKKDKSKRRKSKKSRHKRIKRKKHVFNDEEY